MPSGHVPDDALEHPQMFGGLKCLTPIPKEAIVELHETRLSWYTDEFAVMVDAAYQSIGKPAYSLDTAWSTFATISDALETLF